MRVTQVAHGVHQLSVNVDHILFEGLWEMPKGVSLNSYVVQGDKTALIDGVCGWDGVPESLYRLLDQLGIAPESIAYLVLNHLEPDHAGWIEDFRRIHNHFEVICTKKGAELLEAFFGDGLRVRVVEDDDTLDLGGGRVLVFKETPHVHWPDNMVCFDTQSGTLFSCDAFGSFGRIEASPFDDDYTDEALAVYEADTLRYYANIVGAFSPFVPTAIAKCEGLEIKTIAPGHGLMWRKRLNKIISDYLDYAAYAKGPARKEVALIWGSMYGMTEAGVRAAISALEASGVTYRVHQVPQTDWGTLLMSVWSASAVILAMPTYEYKMFPPMAAALEEIGKKKAQGKLAFRLGSYGWSGGAQKELDEIVERLKLKWHFIEPVEYQGKPKPEDLEKIQARVHQLVREMKVAGAVDCP